MLACNENHHLISIHDSGHSHSECLGGHFADVIVEEPGIGVDGLLVEGLDSGARRQAGARLIEGNVSIWPNTSNKQPDAACVFDHLLVLLALSLQIFSVAVQNVSVLWVDVDVLEEVLVHEGMVALWVVSGQFNILIHVESFHIFE